MTRMIKTLAPVLVCALCLASVTSACCGDLTKSQDVRKDFIDSLNKKEDLGGCKLSGKGEGLVELEISCAELDTAWVEARIKPVCESFKPFGFESFSAEAKDGRSTVAINSGCSFSPEAAATE